MNELVDDKTNTQLPKPQVRTIQRSRKLLYVNLPSSFIKFFELNGSELVKFTATEDGKIQMEMMNL